MSDGRVVLLSGGLDSTAALFWARSRGECFALSVEYGQAHAQRELEAAKRAACAAGVPLQIERLHYPWPEASGRLVPGRNLTLLNMAASHALNGSGSVEVVVGACAADSAAFPDCRPQFLRAAAVAIGLGLGVEVTISAPWLHRTKAQILKESRDFGALCWESVARSWSCYEGGEKPCGACQACILRAEGFADFGAVDRSGSQE